jgi:hypothetical protein
MPTTRSSRTTACSLTMVSCRQRLRGQAHDGKIPSRPRLVPLAVLSLGPTLAGMPSKGVGKGECEGFEDRSGYSPDFDPVMVKGKPGSTWSRHSWDRAAATRAPPTVYWVPPVFPYCTLYADRQISSIIVLRLAAEIRFKSVVQQGLEVICRIFLQYKWTHWKIGHGEPPVSPNCGCPVKFCPVKPYLG